MIIHDESGLLDFASVIKKSLFESNSQVVLNKNSQDYEDMDENDFPMSIPVKRSRESPEIESSEEVKSSKKRLKKTKQISENVDIRSNKISADDLEQLRTVYKKCKSVIKMIETKYGHLLELDELEHKRKQSRNEIYDEETQCQCTLNKKIVFDDDGTEIALDAKPCDHICPKKARYLELQTTQTNNGLQINYHNEEIDLPDSLQELQLILRNPEIEVTYRNQVIQKVRSIKYDFANEMRYNRHSIVEKLKTNMDEMIEFKGSNLSTLSGYVINL